MVQIFRGLPWARKPFCQCRARNAREFFASPPISPHFLTMVWKHKGSAPLLGGQGNSKTSCYHAEVPSESDWGWGFPWFLPFISPTSAHSTGCSGEHSLNKPPAPKSLSQDRILGKTDLRHYSTLKCLHLGTYRLVYKLTNNKCSCCKCYQKACMQIRGRIWFSSFSTLPGVWRKRNLTETISLSQSLHAEF